MPDYFVPLGTKYAFVSVKLRSTLVSLAQAFVQFVEARLSDPLI